MSYEERKTIISGVGIVIIMIALLVYDFHLNYGSPQTYSGYTVTDKAVKPGKDSSTYLVYTEKSGEVMVFCIEDRFLIGRFDASDDYARIEVGKTYSFDTVGVRQHFWSSYPDIIEMRIAE